MDQYLLYLLAAAIVMIAQASVQNAYQRYKTVNNQKGISGAQVAKAILEANGLANIKVEVSNGGILSDHYDPVKHVVRLSSDIYYNHTIASIAVAAHEVGHAIQHKENYGLIAIRNRMLPAVSIASNLGWVTLVLGLMFLNSTPIIFYCGIGLLLVIVAFQVVTLPIEINASSRALVQLEQGGFIETDEKHDCAAMLKAAAFTYLASLVSSIIQVLRMIFIAKRNDD